MADLIDNGYLELTNGTNTLLLFFKTCKCDPKPNPTIKHYAAGGALGFTTGKRWFEWTIRDIMLENHSDFDLCIGTLFTWQDTTPFTLKVKRAAAAYINWDGANSSYTVMIPKNGIKGLEKRSRGTQDNGYYIQFLKLEQCG